MLVDSTCDKETLGVDVLQPLPSFPPFGNTKIIISLFHFPLFLRF